MKSKSPSGGNGCPIGANTAHKTVQTQTSHSETDYERMVRLYTEAGFRIPSESDFYRAQRGCGADVTQVKAFLEKQN